jgi:O-antigen/teichoic acid export membrane protein
LYLQIRNVVLEIGGAKSVRQLPSAVVEGIKHGVFLQNVTTVASGNAIAQAISITASPILSRLYAPADFGILAIYLSVVPILTIIANMQYPIAIVLLKKEWEEKVLLGMIIRIAGLVLVALMTVALGIAFIGPARIGLQLVPTAILPVIALATFISAILEAFNYWNISTKAFSLISWTVVSGSISAALLSIAMGYFAAGWSGLVAGMILGGVVSLLVLLFYGNLLPIVVESLKLSSNKNSSYKILKEHSDFPKYRLPQALLTSLGQNLPAIILLAISGPAASGLFALAKRSLTTPINIISQSVRNVFYQKAASIGNNRMLLFSATIRTTLFLALIGIIPFGVTSVFGQAVFTFVFGAEWRLAGRYATWLSIMTYCEFCSAPSLSIIPVIGFQRQFLIYEIASIFMRITLLVVGAFYGGAFMAIAMFSLISAILIITLSIVVNYQLLSSRIGIFAKL